jgi:hypothetical protein
MTKFQLCIILLTVSVSACAQLLLKLGMKEIDTANGILSNGITSLLHVIFSPLVFSGLTIYGLSTLAWLWILSKVDLSIAYPLLIHFWGSVLFLHYCSVFFYWTKN